MRTCGLLSVTTARQSAGKLLGEAVETFCIHKCGELKKVTNLFL